MRTCRVALITSNGYEGISSPVVNTAIYLANKGFLVDVYVSEDRFCEGLGLDLRLKAPRIDVVKIKEKYFRIFKGVRRFARDIEFCFNVLRKNVKYDFLVAYEQHGLVRGKILSWYWNTPYVYHSLEFYEKKDLLKCLENAFMKDAVVNLTQDKNRVRILSKICDVPPKSFMVSTNSSLGDILPEKKNYFRDKFGIGKEKFIVLFTGSIIEQCYIKEAIESAKKWPWQYVLVIHGWIPDASLRHYIEEQIKNCPEKIYLSTDILPFEEKYTIFQSVDIGLVLFKPVNLNMKYAAGSAGKLYDFMRAGIPVVANKIVGMKKLVKDNGMGEVVGDLNGISDGLIKIANNYEAYRKSAFNAFSRYEFSKSYDKVLDKIRQGR